MNNLAGEYCKAGKQDLALPLFEETIKLMNARWGPDHPLTLTARGNLASVYLKTGKPDLALSIAEETFKLLKAKLGPDDPLTLTYMNNLAAEYWSAKQLDKSIPLFEEALNRKEAKLGRNHQGTLFVVANLGVNYKDAGRHKDAIPLLEEAYRAVRKYPELRFVVKPLLDAYAQTGEYTSDVNLLLELLPEARQGLPKDSSQLAVLLSFTGRGLLDQKKWDEAEPLLRECLALREQNELDVWTTFNAQSLLGGALRGQKKYADAELLLLKGYEGMKKRESLIPPKYKMLRLSEAVERLCNCMRRRTRRTTRPGGGTSWRRSRAQKTSLRNGPDPAADLPMSPVAIVVGPEELT
jgi:tetratricopeptide (TPR) repeat protein